MTLIMAILLSQAPWVALGDSTTNCCSTSGWPYYLAKSCGRAVINDAVAGHTASQIRDDQWPAARDGGVSIVFISGGFNDIHNTDDDAGTVFARLQTVADDAYSHGIGVVFLPPFPAGGYYGEEKEGRRIGLKSLEATWALLHHQGFVDLDDSLINCGDRFNDGAQALCDFARMSDPTHPSEGAEAVIGAFIAQRLQCSPHLPDGGVPQ